MDDSEGRGRDRKGPMGTRQLMDTRGRLILRFSDGVHDRWRRGSLALLSGWLDGVMGYDRREVSFPGGEGRGRLAARNSVWI